MSSYVFEAISTDYIKQRRNKPAVKSRKKDAAHMKQRKEIKKLGKKSLKKHYAIFVAACLIASFIGAEFAGSLGFTKAQTEEQALSQLESDLSGGEGYQIEIDKGGVTWTDVLVTIAEDGTEAGREMTEQTEKEEIEAAETGNPVFGRTRGVLSGVVNQFTSGSILVTLVASAAQITGSENLGILLLIAAGALFAFGFWFLVTNVFQVAVRRIFLEGMIYDSVTPQRFTFLLRVKKWLRASWIMFVKYVFYTLWCLTVVGIAVKRYSYYLVPYIVAENPDMTARQAITLSRKMMDGHKWECFKFELSFIGWLLLGYVTMGLVNVFYTNPYKTASFTGYYAELRAQAIEKNIEGAELLNDIYLYEKAGEDVIAAKYSDVIKVMKEPEQELENLGGWRGFLANNFGIIIMRRRQERLYEKQQAEYVRIHSLIDDVEGLAYPVRLYPIPEENRRMLVQSLNYMRHYTIWSLMAVFLAMSFVGWMWEVSLHLISDGVFVNRGALHGPWLPIYGTGSVLMLTVLYRLRKKPVVEFVSTVVMCGFLEYMTSYVMEIVNDGVKWWDYSGYFLNLNGRICAEGLLVFGVGGLAIVYLVAPVIDEILSRLNEKKVAAVCAALMIAFTGDAVYSHFHPNMGDGITNYAYEEAQEQDVISESQENAQTS